MISAQNIQIRKGWIMKIDNQQFRVVGHHWDEKYRRHYTLRAQGGEERAVRRDSVLELHASGRLCVTTPVEASIIGKIELIRDYAKRGYSLSYTAKALGLYSWDVRRAIELCGANDIEFVKGTQSLGFRESLERLHANRRGRPQPKSQSPEVYAALARGRETLRQRALYTAFGVTGTIIELKQHFDCPLTPECLRKRVLHRGMTMEEALTTPNLNERRAAPPRLKEHTENQRKKYTAFGVTGSLCELKERFGCPVTLTSIRTRISSGMSVEDALTMPVRLPKKGVYPQQLVSSLLRRRRRDAAAIMLIAKKRVTNTMLTYSGTDHDIVMVARSGSVITVEVRFQDGKLLHRLRFLKTFDTGVLFVFDPEINGRLQFIAFEPDAPWLLSIPEGTESSPGAHWTAQGIVRPAKEFAAEIAGGSA